MAYKLIYIPIDDTQHYFFGRWQLLVERLDTQLNEPNNSKLLRQRIRKYSYKTLGTSVITPPPPPPLWGHHLFFFFTVQVHNMHQVFVYYLKSKLHHTKDVKIINTVH